MPLKKKKQLLLPKRHPRSKSMENLADASSIRDKDSRSGKSISPPTGKRSKSDDQWTELSLLKSTAPPVACILSYTARDFVCSAVMAIGARPLIVEDAQDLEKDLQNCKAVVLDINAPTDIIREFISVFVVGEQPLVLAIGQAGTSDRKALLAEEIVSVCGPSVITGKRGDVVSLAQNILEKSKQCHDGEEEEEEEEEVEEKRANGIGADKRGGKRYHSVTPPPSSHSKKEEIDLTHSSPSYLLSTPLRYRKASSDAVLNRSTSPRGVQKAMDESKGNKVHRVPTVLPLVKMKGQFRESCMGDVCQVNSLERAQLLAAHTNALVHIYDNNILTSGEVVTEFGNCQVGTANLHSALPCSAAIMAAVLGSTDNEDENMKYCKYALSLYHVAVEQAACMAIRKDQVLPGSLRQHLLDALNYLDECEVKLRAIVNSFSAGVTTATT